MSYKIHYTTNSGGGITKVYPSNPQALTEIKRLFARRTKARVEKNKIVIGEVYKKDGKWNWYMDVDA